MVDRQWKAPSDYDETQTWWCSAPCGESAKITACVYIDESLAVPKWSIRISLDKYGTVYDLAPGHRYNIASLEAAKLKAVALLDFLMTAVESREFPW